jgi:hypothetical protein
MKQVIFTAICLFLLQIIFAQTLPQNVLKPVVKPKNGTLPKDLKVDLPKPTDLSVSGLRIISMTWNEEGLYYQVRIGYTIKNNGDIPTNAHDLWGFSNVGYISYDYDRTRHRLPEEVLLRRPGTGLPNYPWRIGIGIHRISEVINGNSSYYHEMDFDYNPPSERDGDKFFLVIGVDVEDNTNETKRDNNFSNVLFVTPTK